MPERQPLDRLAEAWKRHAAAIDLDKLRAVANRWTPAAVAALLGGVAGAALGAIGGNWGDLAIPIVGLATSLSAIVATGWMWGRDKAADAREARRNAAAWQNKACDYWDEIVRLREDNARLAGEVDRLTPGEIVARLHERMGERP